MSRTKKIAVLAIIAMVLTLMPAALFAATADSDRLAGAGRVETGLEIASAGWTTASTVILAPADQANLVDALAAAPLAGQENAPILLTFKDSLDAAVKAKIAALGAKKVYVVGAISDTVKSEVEAISGVTVEALKGSSRWETNAAINAKLVNPAGTFVVGYAALADALSVSSFAAKNNYAIVLAGADGKIPVGQSAVGTKTYIIGGPTLVGDITGATRIFGADRFETNTKVAEALSFDYARVYVANGLSLVDALAVAPLAANYNAFVALASGNSVAAASVVNAKLSSSSKVVAVGGTNAVSDSVKGMVAFAVPAQFSVTAVEALSLNAVKVSFNKQVDDDSAKTLANYLVAGTDVGTLAAGSKVIVSSDKMSVTVVGDVNFVTAQFEKKMFMVKKDVIFSKDKLQTAAKYETELTFTDITRPVVSSVAFDGNKKLTVKFSEPVKMPAAAAFINLVPTLFKIDGLQLGNYGYSAAAPKDGTTVNAFAMQLDITFNDAISSGTHTVTVPDGTSAYLVDGAAFQVAKAEMSATVSTVTDAPKVLSITSQTNGEIVVTYDRKMSSDALAQASYNVNDKGFGAASISAVGSFKADTGDTVVTLQAASTVVKEGINTIEVLKDVKDTYGNKMHSDDNYRTSFTSVKDVTKPSIKVVSVLGNGKIRVQFTEKVSNTYGAAATNYDLRDSSNTRVNVTPAAVGTAPVDTYDLTPASAITGDSYTLKITGVRDMADPANTMDTYTTSLTGSDSTRPSIAANTPWIKVSANKLLVMFNETMDATSMTTMGNFYYIKGNGTTWVALPSSTTLSISEDGKGVLITFPTAYTVDNAGTGEYDVKQVQIANVKDKAGNLLDTVSVQNAGAFTAAAAAHADHQASYVADSYKLSVSGDDVVAEFEMTKMLVTAFDKADWTVNGFTPASGYISGKKVYLTFTGANATTIKGLGKAAALASAATASKDTYNIPYSGTLFPIASAKSETIKPKLASMTAASGGAGAATATVVFNENIDLTVIGLSKTDFSFVNTSTGQALTVKSIAAGAANSFTVTFDEAIAATNNIQAKPNASTNIKDVAGNMYVPSSTDLSTGVSVAAV